MKRWIPLLTALAMSAPIYAEPVAAPAAEVAAMSEGVVRKIDAANAKITLKHGPLVNLDMPGMTMVFQVQNPALLDQVKAGDKVRFTAADINGALVVIDLQPVK